MKSKKLMKKKNTNKPAKATLDEEEVSGAFAKAKKRFGDH